MHSSLKWLLQILAELNASDEDGLQKGKEDGDKQSTSFDASTDQDVQMVSSVEDDMNVRALKARIEELENINKQLYNYAAALILDEEWSVIRRWH